MVWLWQSSQGPWTWVGERPGASTIPANRAATMKRNHKIFHRGDSNSRGREMRHALNAIFFQSFDGQKQPPGECTRLPQGVFRQLSLSFPLLDMPRNHQRLFAGVTNKTTKVWGTTDVASLLLVIEIIPPHQIIPRRTVGPMAGDTGHNRIVAKGHGRRWRIHKS